MPFLCKDPLQIEQTNCAVVCSPSIYGPISKKKLPWFDCNLYCSLEHDLQSDIEMKQNTNPKKYIMGNYPLGKEWGAKHKQCPNPQLLVAASDFDS